jgi:hypothetical protein
MAIRNEIFYSVEDPKSWCRIGLKLVFGKLQELTEYDQLDLHAAGFEITMFQTHKRVATADQFLYLLLEKYNSSLLCHRIKDNKRHNVFIVYASPHSLCLQQQLQRQFTKEERDLANLTQRNVWSDLLVVQIEHPSADKKNATCSEISPFIYNTMLHFESDVSEHNHDLCYELSSLIVRRTIIKSIDPTNKKQRGRPSVHKPVINQRDIAIVRKGADWFEIDDETVTPLTPKSVLSKNNGLCGDNAVTLIYTRHGSFADQLATVDLPSDMGRDVRLFERMLGH